VENEVHFFVMHVELNGSCLCMSYNVTCCML